MPVVMVQGAGRMCWPWVFWGFTYRLPDCTIPAIEVSDEDIASTFDTNIFSVIAIIRELSPLLIATKGKIVNIGSITAVTPYVFGAVYNATKGALQAYSNTLRLELAPFGVRVILVVTGGVQSRIARTDRRLGEDSLYLPIHEEYLRRVKHSQGELFLLFIFLGRGVWLDERGVEVMVMGKEEKLMIRRGRYADESLLRQRRP